MNSRDAVIKVLQAAASQDVNLMKDAEAQLKTWEVNQGFYSTLLEIFLLKNLDVNIRWMSIIYLKNGVTKYWRKTGQNCLSEVEKVFIRNKIITVFDEEVIQLALQLAVIIGKIVRIDIKQWPDAIQQTLQVIKLGKAIHQHRALLTLNQILKGLASKRLVADQLVFREISADIFEYLAGLNSNYYSFALLSTTVTDLNSSLEMCVLITKIMRKLIVFGGKQYAQDSIQIKYLQFCLQHIPPFLSLHNGCTDVSSQEKCEKLLILLMKIFSEMLERHSLSFVAVLEETLKLCLERIFASNGTCEFNNFVIYCGNLLRTITRTYNNKKTATTNEESLNLMKTANEIKSRVLTDDCVKRLCQHLIMEFFPLTETELEEWSGDPEGYMLVEAGESHKFLLRPCMESLFVGLFYEFKNEINPFVLNLTRELNLMNIEQMSDNELLKVCCVCTSVGLASYELFHDLDFDVWFENKLIAYLSLPLKPLPVFQQHILWMIGEWINVKFSKKNRIVLYQILSRVLTNCPDLVLQLTACKVLRSAIDDFDFDADDFTPYVNEIFVALCKLLVTVELCDSKMMVLNSLSIMIERINEKVRSQADLLLQCLPKLWELSEAHNLLRGAVINVLVHLVKGLGNESMKILHITLPIIQFSTSVDQPAHVYLLEDGLELWLTVLKNIKFMNDELLMIYKNIPVLFERASETLGICLSITRLYLLIDAKIFLKDYSAILSKVFSELLGNIKQDPTSKIAKILKLSLQLLPADFLSMFQSNVLDVLDYILKDEIYPMLMVDYLSIYAYVVLHQPAGFGDVVGTYCKTNTCTYEDVMERLLDIWLEKVDCMSLEDKKVTGLALCSMIPHKFKFIFDRFTLILDTCVNVMYDLQKTQGEDGEHIVDSLVVDMVSASSDVEDDIEYTRERMALQHDPAYTVTLLHYVKEKLTEAKQTYGDQLFAEAMETMDSAVAKQLLSLINT